VKIALFVHSLVSCWNHGNAHFIRGVARELLARGHELAIYEPEKAWSREYLVREHGKKPLRDFAKTFPQLSSKRYGQELAIDTALKDVDIALVHEWNEPWVVARVGASGVPALFHDTHHRSATDPDALQRYDLSGYAGVLAYGSSIAARYREHGWHDKVWVWHEAADTRLFQPRPRAKLADIVWIGNWGDGERTIELRRFLLEPARRLSLRGTIHGVRYPDEAVRAVRASGLDYGGWLANHRVPATFARHRVTVHVPRRAYVQMLPGIPTIRPFEALACGIPLVSSPWDDTDGLFTAGDDYLVARDGKAMERCLREVLSDQAMARRLAQHGRETILARHTCSHRVDELLAIVDELGITAQGRVAA
jgi:spore maturation protein CgeB